MPSRRRDSDADSHASTSSSCSELEFDDFNRRMSPKWARYRLAIQARGYALDTNRDVKEHYLRCCDSGQNLDNMSGYRLACGSRDEDALCKDAGLPDNLFRGSRIRDRAKVVVKAVHLRSREFDIIRFISSPPLRDDPMNHCIPVLDLLELREDGLGLIIMEEWSSQLITDAPCCLRLFLAAIQQCIEHTVFLHAHDIAHLDISLRNLLTDDKGHYACIDYELSRRRPARVHGRRGTELPPELERGDACDPYKVDVWALAVLILRACKLAGYYVPELMHLTKPMLYDNPDNRPTAAQALTAFNCLISRIDAGRLESCSHKEGQ